MLTLISKNKLNLIAAFIFITLSAWWVTLNVNGLAGETDDAEMFSATYGLMALFGGIAGLFISKYWGGFKSLIGRSILMISFGLLAQEVGQITYSMYTYLFQQEIPYPSLGDIGYFGSVLFYLAAGYYLIKALNPKMGLKSVGNKLAVVIVPIVLLAVSYAALLRDYSFEETTPLTVFLDFGYPFGQALYISLALIAFVLSRNYLGGIMKPVLLSTIFALSVQYVSDFTFLYQTHRDLWQTAGINEYMYLFSYFVMSVTLIRFGMVAQSLKGKHTDEVQQ